MLLREAGVPIDRQGAVNRDERKPRGRGTEHGTLLGPTLERLLDRQPEENFVEHLFGPDRSGFR